MRAACLTVALLLAAFSLALGEIEKIAIPCEQGLCFHWWPKLPPVDGWHHERDYSLKYGANALAPDGFNFANAETVMYVRALYKHRMPDTKSLEALIDHDKKEFLTTDPTIAISEASALTSADGQRMRSFTFFPKGRGNWERVTYGEEGDFFLIFTVSARSEDGYRKAQPAYEALVTHYRAKP
jgi:hypothetical protein